MLQWCDSNRIFVILSGLFENELLLFQYLIYSVNKWAEMVCFALWLFVTGTRAMRYLAAIWNGLNIICIKIETALNYLLSHWTKSENGENGKKLVQSDIQWNHLENIKLMPTIFHVPLCVCRRNNRNVEYAIRIFSAGTAQFGTWHCKTCVG